MKKSSFHVNRNCIVHFIVLLILIIAQIYVSNLFIYHRDKESYQVQPSELANISGYEVKDNGFEMVEDDPQILILNSVDEIHRIEIHLTEPAEKKIQVELYYIKDDKVLEKADVITLHRGDDKAVFRGIRECGELLRLDINGDFKLESLFVSGAHVSFSPKRFAIYLGGCIFFDICLAILMIKKWKQAYRQITSAYERAANGLQSLGKRLHLTIYRFYVLAAVLLSIAYSFLMPVTQVPDEATHVVRMCEAVGADGLYLQYWQLTADIGAYDVKDFHEIVDLDVYVDGYLVKFDKERIDFKPHFSLSAISYLPMLAGVFLGYIMDMPILWCMQLGELFAIFFSVVLGYLALRLMPVKKELLCAILLLPMNIQQCSSLNYDAVLLPVCYLLIAYIFHLKYRKEKVKWRDLLWLVLMLLVIAITKVLYVVLALLWFMIPIEHTDFKIGRLDFSKFFSKHKILLGLLVAVGFAAACYVVRNVSYVMALRACLMDPAQGFSMLKMTTEYMTREYLKSFVGNFGFLDAIVPPWFVVFVLGFLMLFTQVKNSKNRSIKMGQRILFGVLALFVAVLINASMITWTFFVSDMNPVTFEEYRLAIKEIGIILGVQGRYFLPMAPIAYMFWEGILKIKKEHLLVWQVVYYAVTFTVPIWTILNRYWLA